jgi:bacteriorhodopsin
MVAQNKHHHIIKHTANSSLVVQIITAIIDLYVLMLNIPKPYLVLKQLLMLEFVVQLVEGSFYVWLATSFNTIENITPYRYFDWFITTPTMLITLTIYLIYLNDYEKDKKKDKKKDKNDNINKTDDFFTILKNNSKNITYIIILNALMLSFGLLNEYNILNKYVAVFCGFMPFAILFYLIYENYAKQSKQGTTIFIYFCAIWSIYGVAALMPYHWKNIFYNILDLFAKNFFGLYLAYILWVNSK